MIVVQLRKFEKRPAKKSYVVNSKVLWWESCYNKSYNLKYKKKNFLKILQY